ncbi:MAG: DUF4105 domain-containing protein [bacterium]|nr:DUF4105 domain-containing protein [bacterium]
MFLSLWLLLANASLAGGGDYLQSLVGEARARDLASQRYWHKLVHYRDTGIGTLRSTAKGEGFLLAEGGLTDPEAELEATLAAFFAPAVEGAVQHPQCRFAARYRWLDEQLVFDRERLPQQPCSEFDLWYETIDPQQITLVFASAYVNSPASMYGHTLLRIDQPGRDSSDQLVAYALNHSAVTDENNGILFAVMGLTGGYLGQFTLLPYYDKVKEYNDLESRDLWEYELTLTRDEIDRVMRHAWELSEVGFRYYFFLQNCSYRLLELLELARPGLELAGAFRVWAIPTDTVREVLETEGMLAAVHFRPGAATVLRHHLGTLTRRQRVLARELAHGETDPDEAEVAALEPEVRARVLQVAYEYLHQQTLAGDTTEELAAPRLLSLLVARSRVPFSEPLEPPPMPEVRPDQGHGTSRVAIEGGGFDGQPFASVRIRGVYHDQLDPQGGFQENAQINFLEVEVRRFFDDETTQLERVDLIDLNSLTPRDALSSPMSWNVRFGLERQRTPDAGRHIVTLLEGGSSWAYRPSGQVGGTILYAGLQSSLQFGDDLPRSWRIGAGPRAGLIADWNRLGRFKLEGQSLWHLDESRPEWLLSLEYRLPLTPNTALGVRVRHEEAFGIDTDEVAVGLLIYL